MLFTPVQWSTELTPSFALFTCLFRHLGNPNQVGKPIN